MEKQVFSWRAKRVQICCIFKWQSRFFVTPRKDANFVHYYVEKHVFSWRAKKVQICSIFKWKSRFSRDAPKRCKFVAFLSGKAVFLQDAPKRCKFVAFLSGKAGFLVTRQNYKFWCIITWKAGFLVTHPKDANLLHYYVEKQVFSWRAKKVQICCILSGKAGFLVTCQKRARYIHIITLVTWSDGSDHVEWLRQERPDHMRRSRVWSGRSWRSHETWADPSDQVTKVMMFLLYTYIKLTTTNSILTIRSRYGKIDTVWCDVATSYLTTSRQNFVDVTISQHVTAEQENVFIVFNFVSLI